MGAFRDIVDAAKEAVFEVKHQFTNEYSAFNEPLKKPVNQHIPPKKKKIEDNDFIFCNNCGEKLFVDSKFCYSCGTRVSNYSQKKETSYRTEVPPTFSQGFSQRRKTKKVIFCNNCGEKLAVGSNFCYSCGAHIGDFDTQKKESATERKTVYDGTMHKCPRCGEVINSFVTVCPTCRYELRDTRKGVVYELVQKLEKAKSDKQKIDIIRNFYIPNTKEDIYEFSIIASSNINVREYDAEAWYAKLEQAHQKAKISFGNTSEFQYVDLLYNKATKQMEKQQRSKLFAKSIRVIKYLASVLLVIIGAGMIIFGAFRGSYSGDSDSPFYYLLIMGMCLFGFGIYAIYLTYTNSKENK